MSSVAPDERSTELVPKAVALPAFSVPASTWVVPAYVLAPLSVTMPAPFWVMVPVPPMALAVVLSPVTLYASVASPRPPSVTAPAPSFPAPVRRIVPSLIKVCPAYVLARVN